MPSAQLYFRDREGHSLERTLGHDGVYVHRIFLDCITYGTEETTNAYFQFVLRENHNAKCGGDPETSPVVDRYRVYRRSGKIEWLDPGRRQLATVQAVSNQVALIRCVEQGSQSSLF